MITIIWTCKAAPQYAFDHCLRPSDSSSKFYITVFYLFLFSKESVWRYLSEEFPSVWTNILSFLYDTAERISPI